MRGINKNFLIGTSLGDALAIVIMIIFYNFYITIAYDTLEYINKYKVIWAFIGGAIIFVPMYLITWITLRKMKSSKLFFIISWVAWGIEPFFVGQGRSKTFNAWQGTNQIYENGELTIYGYFHGLQSPFFLLALYATFFLLSSKYRKFQNQQGGFDQ